MKTSYIIIVLAMLSALLATPVGNCSAQQEGTYVYADGLISDYQPRLMELDASRNLMIKYSRFGFDSSYVSLMWLDHFGTILSHKEHRLTVPLTFIMDAVKMDNGFLTCGVMPNANSPFLMRMDTAGNIQRIDFVYSLGNEQLYRLLKRPGNQFSVYASSPMTYNTTVRMDGSMSDTVFEFHRIIAPINHAFRLYQVIDGGSNKDIMAGAISYSGAQMSGGLLMKLDTVAADWAKSYEFTNYSDEYIAGITRLSNGNYCYVAQGVPAGGVNYDSFVGIADASGNPVWSKQVAIPGAGVLLSTVVEMNSGELLVAGNSSNYAGVVLKFSATGNLLWKKTIPATGGIIIAGLLSKRLSGELALTGYVGGNSLLVQMDAIGSNCIFENDTVTSVTPVTPFVTSLPSFIISSQIKNSGPGSFSSRNLSPLMTTGCMGNGLPVESATYEIMVYPNPAYDYITINFNLPFQQPLLLEIFDVAGRIVYSENIIAGNGGSKISSHNLHGGMYFYKATGKSGCYTGNFLIQRE